MTLFFGRRFESNKIVMYGRPPFRKVSATSSIEKVGAVMYPACLCGGYMPLAPMVSVAALSHHPGVLFCTMTNRSVRGPVCLPISPSVAAVLLAKGWRVSRWPARDRVGYG